MNKKQLVKKIADGSSLKQKDVAEVLNVFMETVGETLAHGDEIRLVGFGSFGSRKRAARTGKNPRTGKTLQIPSRNVPTFKAGKLLKHRVEKRK